MPHRFSAGLVPGISFGVDAVDGLPKVLADISPDAGAVLLVIDSALAERGLARRLTALLESAGVAATLYADIAGEPKDSQIDAAAAAARAADAKVVVAVGGGSALDVGKLAACVAAGTSPARAYALAATPLPAYPLKTICVPTTAGTGSELSITAVFSVEGRKMWAWGEGLRASRVVLDPALTLSVPPELTAWTGFDALTHAMEACTNRARHVMGDLFAHRALGLIAQSLPQAVSRPDDLAARCAMTLGAAYAGVALGNCGTAMAHNISHALGSLAPIHHGRATAIGLDVTLGWSSEGERAGETGAGGDEDGGGGPALDAPFAAAARACGLRGADELADWHSALMARCGVTRRLPEAFAAFSAADLAAAMRAPENQPMREASARLVTEADVDRFAAAVMAGAAAGATAGA